MQLFHFHKVYPTVLSGAQTGSCLTPALERCGFELWHHYFPAKNLKTGEDTYFFIDFMLLNTLQDDEKSLFQNQHVGLVYAGILGKKFSFCGELFSSQDMVCSKRTLSLRLGSNVCLEDSLVGNIIQDEQHCLAKLGVGNWGSISFELKLAPVLLRQQSFPSFLPYILNGYETYWQTSQLKTAYEGHIVVNEQEYSVKTVDGYKDKTWGKNFGHYWVKVYGGNLTAHNQEADPNQSAFLLICHSPVLWNYDLGKKHWLVLIINGTVYQFSHTIYSKQALAKEEISKDHFIFHFSAWNFRHKVDVELQLPVDCLHPLAYPNPQNLLQRFLVASPIEVKIKLFSSKNVVNWQLTDEIIVQGACLEQT